VAVAVAVALVAVLAALADQHPSLDSLAKQ